ncbi:Flagellar FliJ protein [compost metagenome]
MKDRINVLSRLATLRGIEVRQVKGRVNYQQNLCQRYRENIVGLNRLCGYDNAVTSAVQRQNQQQYKATLHAMINLQVRELAAAQEHLTHMQGQLMQAVRKQKVLTQVIDAKVRDWQMEQGRQEQNRQDGLASQAWWRNLKASG